MNKLVSFSPQQIINDRINELVPLIDFISHNINFCSVSYVTTRPPPHVYLLAAGTAMRFHFLPVVILLIGFSFVYVCSDLIHVRRYNIKTEVE